MVGNGLGRHVQGTARDRAELLKSDVTMMLPKEVEEALVIPGRHVEQLDQQPIAPACLFQPLADERPEIVAGEISRHEGGVDRRPERRPSADDSSYSASIADRLPECGRS